MRTLFYLRLCSVLALLLADTTAAQRENYELTAAQKLLFDSPHLENLLAGDTVRYHYAKTGTLEAGFEDEVELLIGTVLEDQRRSLETNFLSGDRRIPFASSTGFRGNPVIMLFLERDAREMSRLTGGSAVYFRNRMRHALRHPDVKTEPVRVAFAGADVNGTQIQLAPFGKAPLIDRYPALAGKHYTFIISSQLPGGIYRLESVAPSESGGEPIIREVLLFNQARGASGGDPAPTPPQAVATPKSQSS